MTGTVLLGCALGVNLGIIAVYAVLAWRLRRAMDRIWLLDRLLAQICVEAFSLQHQPIWQAWASVMGSIQVEVPTHRRDWAEGSDG